MSNYSPEEVVKSLESIIASRLHHPDKNSPLGIYSDSEMATAFLNLFYTQQGFDVVCLPLMDCASSTDSGLLLDKRWLEVMDKAQLLTNPVVIIEQSNFLPHSLINHFYQKINHGMVIARRKYHVSFDERVVTGEISSHCYVPLVVTCHDYSDNQFDSQFHGDNYLYISENDIYRVKSIKNKMIVMKEEHDSLFFTAKNPDEVSPNMTQLDDDRYQGNENNQLQSLKEVLKEHFESLEQAQTQNNPAAYALQVPVPMNRYITFIDEADTCIQPQMNPDFQIKKHVNKQPDISSDVKQETDGKNNISTHSKLLNMFNSFSNYLAHGALSKFKSSFFDNNKKLKP
jgi:hypothetical protein